MATPALPSGVPYWRTSDPAQPIAACEVLSEVEYVSLAPSSVGHDPPDLDRVRFSYVVVVSEDCDLEWDHKARSDLASAGPQPAIGTANIEWAENDRKPRDKLMTGVLLCVADEEEKVRQASIIKSRTTWNFAQSNQHERYHLLRAAPPDVDLQGVGFPALMLDFKRYFTLTPDELRRRLDQPAGQPGRALRRASLASPFLEDVASRFHQYQSRVALPDEERPA